MIFDRSTVARHRDYRATEFRYVYRLPCRRTAVGDAHRHRSVTTILSWACVIFDREEQRSPHLTSDHVLSNDVWLHSRRRKRDGWLVTRRRKERERRRTGRRRRKKREEKERRQRFGVNGGKKGRMALRYLCLIKPNVKDRVVNATKRKERSEVRKHATEATRFPRLVASLSRFWGASHRRSFYVSSSSERQRARGFGTLPVGRTCALMVDSKTPSRGRIDAE